MRVLIVSPIFPDPVISGGATRLRNLIRHAGRRHALHMIALLREDQWNAKPDLEGLAAPAQLIGARVNYSLRQQLSEAIAPCQWRRTMVRTLDRLKQWPAAVRKVYFPDLAARIAATLREHAFDVVQLEYTEMGRYLGLVRRYAPRARIVLEEIDIAYVALDRLLTTGAGNGKRSLAAEVSRMKGFEQSLWPNCDAIVTMSDVDRNLIVACGQDPARVKVVPNGVDPAWFSFRSALPASHSAPPVEQGHRVLFLGYFKHPPNVSAIRFLAQTIWPQVRGLVPDARLDVVGDSAPDDIRRLDGTDGITIHGFVPEVRPIMDACGAMIVPILNGGGTRLKVLEAFAAGLPVVSTTLGCEGIAACDGDHVLIADSAPELSQALAHVLTNHQAAHSLASRARALVEHCYSWTAIAGQLEEVWNHVHGA